MTYQFGVLTGADNIDNKLPINQIGQEVAYEDLQRYLDQVRQDEEKALAVFVEEDTEAYSESYALPGGAGRMQRRGRQSSVGAVKNSGKVDVAYPIEDFADALGWNDIDYAYMSVREYERQVNNIVNRHINTVRYEMIKAVVTNTTRTFIDDMLRTPTLTVQPLANGDSVVYPPTPGSDDGATDDHYQVTGFTAASISNTNDPVPAAVSDLIEHFGGNSNGANIAYFCNTDVSAKIQDLTAFTPVSEVFIVQGANADRVTNTPANLPGVVKGRHASGAWIVEWLWNPTGYSMTIDLDTARPLKRRVDPAFTNLPRGLALVATNTQFPLTASYWRARYGFGVGNRLNGVVQKFAASGAYSVPSAYA